LGEEEEVVGEAEGGEVVVGRGEEARGGKAEEVVEVVARGVGVEGNEGAVAESAEAFEGGGGVEGEEVFGR